VRVVPDTRMPPRRPGDVMQPLPAPRHEPRDVPLVDHLLIAVGHPILEELEIRVAHPSEGRAKAAVRVLLVDVADVEAQLVAEDLEVPAQIRRRDADVVDAGNAMLTPPAGGDSRDRERR
jgi:hypothetical protein